MTSSRISFDLQELILIYLIEKALIKNEYHFVDSIFYDINVLYVNQYDIIYTNMINMILPMDTYIVGNIK